MARVCPLTLHVAFIHLKTEISLLFLLLLSFLLLYPAYINQLLLKLSKTGLPCLWKPVLVTAQLSPRLPLCHLCHRGASVLFFTASFFVLPDQYTLLKTGKKRPLERNLLLGLMSQHQQKHHRRISYLIY